MKTVKEMLEIYPKAMVQVDVYASYYTDEDREEWLFFKMLPFSTVQYLVRAMHQMKLFKHYQLDIGREDYRNGYINEKWRMRMIGRSEDKVPLCDLKLITAELVSVMGFRLHWLSVEDILNMKNDWE